MKRNNKTGELMMTEAELNAIVANAVANAEETNEEIDETDWRNNPAPTTCGKAYHSFCQERNRKAAEFWDEAAAASPFGGAFCRMMGGLARVREAHHAQGGFFGTAD